MAAYSGLGALVSSMSRNWNSASAFGIGSGSVTSPGVRPNNTPRRLGGNVFRSTQFSRPPLLRDGVAE